ncbi:unnamed protein product [Meloidogyne enterolobii]|uniref:Uncharacterized protein n=1 Tax=Meloidogyne enterolobii TaxID=390850 RepID=A0ACB0ZFK2_MELEN
MRRPQTQQTSSTQNNKSLERKVQKTMANLKASESLLPKSLLDRDSKLVPNNVAAKTFKHGRTLHNVLCCNDLSPKKVNKVPTTSSTRDRGRIPFYRNVNRSANSTNNSVSLSTTKNSSQVKEATTIGPKRKIEFSKALDPPLMQNPRFDESGYAIPNTTNSTPKIKITRDINKQNNHLFGDSEFLNNSVQTISPNVYRGRAAVSTDGDENFESAFEESFDTEERERREQIDKLEKINKNKDDKFSDFFDVNIDKTIEAEDDNFPINLPSIPTEIQPTFIADLDKHVKEIKEGLNFVSEKLDSVVGHMDKTLGDSNIYEENGMASNKFGRLSTSFKSTQTPESWINKNNEETSQNKGFKFYLKF